jgi:hypothetical protein
MDMLAFGAIAYVNVDISFLAWWSYAPRYTSTHKLLREARMTI